MQVNGEQIQLSSLQGNLLTDLIHSLGLNPGRVAVELNGRIVPMDEVSSIQLNDTDSVELIQFAGGG